MDNLLQQLNDPIVITLAMAIVTFLSTEIAKKLKMPADYVVYALAFILGSLYVATTNLVPQSILDRLFSEVAKILGLATVLYNLYKRKRKN